MIAQAIAHNDTVALYKAAHALRSLSISIGAGHLSQLSATLEEFGRADTLIADIPGLLRDIQAEYERLATILRRYVEKQP